MFRKAKQNRIFQDVVDQIQEAIVEGRLKEGDQLPAERKLQEEFNVSRGTLREALRVLEQKGLIEIRTGVAGGSVIKGVSTEQVSESLALLIRYQKVPLAKLAEFREGVEGIVAALAANRATSEQTSRLQELLSTAGEYLEQGEPHWDAFIRTDEEFHLALAEMTDNPLFITVLETVYHNIHTYYERYLPMEETVLRQNYQDLKDLFAAVAARDGKRAEELAREHVRRFNTRMEERHIS
ncbi:FadR family transcriptional regulator [Geobacter sulfurreducens]|jgi:GntR family transcriptional repressor for pyruvate dehydrogenase complex|uniref:Helix-turn-helix transcriptional regulator, GntR family n=1 Tax=Geobacter sulfurreducens (strain ATCC 51573 / DSM 12127 / PCA) TaxID=243231 RepID=Q746X2_GEOSL|nr:FadR/GntR family transcriptional regulator [Geobacter sulfurreducens]AAR36786.1 helix-turn-helix transcriptional regulator, GntR family [Geobacter sulfurreducens PCA]QVW35206.1 FadR family transcriptional regulator [Geobacter sulfurreducens]UAC04043.1 FadR family transcriptional regulator [Geobacter sulfurreducens]UTG92680.1 FadR family transcriptional regulator [Geobacter sulfurreducens]HBB70069.1 FadR family transcriptional regulator [Geobacter sulfurreducens]